MRASVKSATAKRAPTSISRAAPYGSMAETAVAPSAHCLALPDDLDEVTPAAIANPGMSSWAAYTERAKLNAGETLLVNGAAGAAGRLAVQIADALKSVEAAISRCSALFPRGSR